MSDKQPEQQLIEAFAEQWDVPVGDVIQLMKEATTIRNTRPSVATVSRVTHKTSKPEQTIFHIDVTNSNLMEPYQSDSDAHVQHTVSLSGESDLVAEQDHFDFDFPSSFLGRYEDLGLLGVGGMGEVRRVRDLDLRRTLAMKIIHPNLLGAPRSVSRFVEEAQVEAQLQHPNIVPVYEIGQLPDGRHYFTMKEIRGVEFSKKIQAVHRASLADRWRMGPDGTTFRDLIRIFQRVCDAVAFSHSQGVIHRDLKPENIMIGGFGEVLVVDWGLAKVLGREEVDEVDEVVETDRSVSDVHQTRMGSVAGTPCYMAPEQAFGRTEELGPWTDIYTLGAILYELLAGKPPFSGATVDEVLEKVKYTQPPSLYQDDQGTEDGPAVEDADRPALLPAHAKVSERLIEISMKAMSHNISDRIESASVLSADIKSWLEGAEKRDKGLEEVMNAQAMSTESLLLQKQAMRAWDEANRLIENEGDQSKQGWAHWERCCELNRESEALSRQAVQHLNGALIHAPDLEEAHQDLAELKMIEFVDAIAQGDRLSQDAILRQLRNHLNHLPVASRQSVEARIEKARTDTIAIERLRRGEIVGRHDQRDRVVSDVHNGQRFVTLLGTAGVGKTRLALELAEDLREDFERVVFCNLTQAVDSLAVILYLSRSLNVRLRDKDPERHLEEVLSAQSTLLVLDNLEQVIDAIGPMIEGWLQASDRLVVCCTSRHRLETENEMVVPVKPVGLLGAVDLFGRRAQVADKSFEMTRENREQVCTVVRKLDCLPLAIELAAARLNLFDLESLYDRLDERFSVLRSRGREAQALEAALDWSWGLLSPWTQVALAQSSIFRGGFTLPAAEKVVQVDGGPKVPGMFDILGELVDNSLMRGDRSEQGEVRYDLLESIREYAFDKLSTMEDLIVDSVVVSSVDCVQHRHAKYFSALGSPEAIHSLQSMDADRQWELLFEEFDNLVAGTKYGYGESAAFCCFAAMKVLSMKGPLRLGIDMAGQILDIPELGKRINTLIEIERIRCLRMSGRLEEARSIVMSRSPVGSENNQSV